MRIPKRNLKYDKAFQNWPDLTQILLFSPAEPIASPPTQPSLAGPSASEITPILKKKRSIQIKEKSDSDTSSFRRSKRQSKIQKKISDQQTQSIIQEIQDAYGYSNELAIFDTKFIGTVFSRDPNERLTIDPNPNLPTESDDSTWGWTAIR